MLLVYWTTSYNFWNGKKRRSKYLILAPGARRTFYLSSHTPRIPFDVLSRKKNV